MAALTFDTGSHEPSATGSVPRAPSQHASPRPIELTVVVPTFNEVDNIGELFKRVEEALRDISWELVFVDDDSPDGTAEAVRRLAISDRRVRLLQRIGRRGLSSACIEGMLTSPAPYIAIMDADLQHDESLLPQMVELLRAEDIDIVVGSRYISGGGVGAWAESRVAMSQFANKVGQFVLRVELSDPMSGFFMVRREVIIQSVRRLSKIGYKILFDIFASAPNPLRFKELPYTFRPRYAGESKLDARSAWDYGMLLLDKLIGHIVPVRFVAFSLVGGLGVIVHLVLLMFSYQLLSLTFVLSQTAATIGAMTFNFLLNNLLTYRDQRLRGWRIIGGWMSFSVSCSVGAIANVGVASFLYNQKGGGWILSALAGVLVGAVWNYAVTSIFTWRVRE